MRRMKLMKLFAIAALAAILAPSWTDLPDRSAVVALENTRAQALAKHHGVDSLMPLLTAAK